jgi:hypothetical protein
MEIVANIDIIDSYTKLSFEDANSNNTVYECREDMAAFNFITVVINIKDLY